MFDEYNYGCIKTEASWNAGKQLVDIISLDIGRICVLVPSIFILGSIILGVICLITFDGSGGVAF